MESGEQPKQLLSALFSLPSSYDITNHMHWIYLSPHTDDAVLSCGGLIYEQAQAGDTVEVWTFFTADPPPGSLLSPFAQELHARWGGGLQAYVVRRAEDMEACARLGAVPRHFDLPECIYRRLPGGEPVIHARDDLFRPYQPGEQPLVETIAALLRQEAPAPARLVCPLTAGGHVDHRLVRAAAESVREGLWYYADYPYAAQEEFGFHLGDYTGKDWETVSHPIGEEALGAWQAAVGAYRSQISSFWGSEAEMRASIADFREQGGKLYRRR